MAEAETSQRKQSETIIVETKDGKRRVRRRRSRPAEAEALDASTDESPSEEAENGPPEKVAPATPAPYVATPTVIVEEDFAALFESYEGQDTGGRFEPGDSVDATVEIISVDGPEIFLDLGGKTTGFVMKEELLDRNGELRVAVGDTVSGVVAGVSANGVHVRTALGRGEVDLDAMRAAHEAGLTIEGKVEAVNSGGFEIETGGVRAFCPMSHMDLGRIEDTESWVGRVLTFKVLEMKERSAVLSRRALLEGERAKNREALLGSLKVGSRLAGVVRSVQSYGVFVDLGGVDGLVHVSELGWGRVKDPNQVVSVGQEVEVVILEINTEDDRIALSLKAASDDPFLDAVRGLAVGSVIEGPVVRLTSFGAFVHLAEGVDGLVHVSDMAHYHVKDAKEMLSVGDRVRVSVTNIDLDERKIGLSLKALSDDPWSDIAQRFAVGQTVQGTVARVASFGVFVDIEEGVTALLPGSHSGIDDGKPLTSQFRVGRSVEARVLRVDAGDRKMALTRLEQEEELPEAERGQDGSRSWTDKNTPVQEEAVGSFGALLQAALGGEDDA